MTGIVFCPGPDPARRSPHQVSRIKCVLMPFDHCADCPNHSFQVLLPTLRKLIPCPLGKLAAEARGSDLVYRLRGTNPVLARDVIHAMKHGLDNTEVDIQLCKLNPLFYTCTSCQGRDDYDPRP